MNKKLLILLIVLVLLLASCVIIYQTVSDDSSSENSNQIYCATDVRECADGSFVSRDAANNCAFEACP